MIILILDRIKSIIQGELSSIPSPVTGRVIETPLLNSKTCTVRLENGDVLEDVACLNYPSKDTECLIIYLGNDPNQPFCIPMQDNSSDVAKALGYGAFTVEDDCLFVELPENTENPFSLTDGDLYVDDSIVSDANSYKIDYNHVFRDTVDLGECKGKRGETGERGSKGVNGDTGASITNIELYDDNKIKLTWSNGKIEVFSLWD